MPSSVIQSYRYYAHEQRLRVTYLSGKTYDYFGVPAEVFAAMKAYQSKGGFLNQQIKGRYRYQLVSE